MQSFTEISPSLSLTASLEKIMENDKTAASHFSGESFPTVGLIVGMTCLRTDQWKLYQLQDTQPTWTLIADLAKTPMWAQSAYADIKMVVRGGAATAKGGQVVFGYGNAAAENIIEAGNSTWAAEVTAVNAFRLYRISEAGVELTAMSIDEATGRATFAKGITVGDSINFGGNVADRAALKSWRETLVAANSSANYALDCNAANVFNLTLNANCTLAFANVPAGVAFGVTLKLTQDATGSRTVTWPASVKWAGATVPTLTTTAGKTDFVSLSTYDGGGTWFGFLGGKNF